MAAKQEILEELGITRRLVMVIRRLGEETEVLKIENEIQDELKTQIDKNQKEYYLREQIKVSDRARRTGRSRRSGKLPHTRARPQAAEGVRGQAHP